MDRIIKFLQTNGIYTEDKTLSKMIKEFVDKNNK